MNSGSSGGFNRTTYDRCAYQKKLYESVDPLGHIMYPGKFENCRKCVQDETQFWRPFDAKIVDAESELKNITRIYTRCPQYKYSPNLSTIFIFPSCLGILNFLYINIFFNYNPPIE